MCASIRPMKLTLSLSFSFPPFVSSLLFSITLVLSFFVGGNWPIAQPNSTFFFALLILLLVIPTKVANKAITDLHTPATLFPWCHSYLVFCYYCSTEPVSSLNLQVPQVPQVPFPFFPPFPSPNNHSSFISAHFHPYPGAPQIGSRKTMLSCLHCLGSLDWPHSAHS